MTVSTQDTKHPAAVVDRSVSGFTVHRLTGEILERPSPPARSSAARRHDEYLADADEKLLDYLDNFSEFRAAAAVGEIPPPPGGWKRAWRRVGHAAAALYLEQRAKTHKKRVSPVQSEFRSPVDFTCDKTRVWLSRGECKTGAHDVASEIVCGREWCGRCSQNASPGVEGSKAHRRRIARWLPKALQLHNIGYLVMTYPFEIREALRDPAELAEDGKRLKRALQNAGFERGMRRLHWFGEPENGVNGVPVYHPHWNILTDSGFLPPEKLDEVKAIWRRLLKRRYGYSGPVVVNYTFATTPGQKYHRVRYVTRSTFLNREWDEQMAGAVIGFRNASTWGKWDGPALWEPERADVAPTDGAQRAAVGICPGEHPEPVLIEYEGRVVDSFRLGLATWRDVGEGFYYRHKPQWAGAP